MRIIIHDLLTQEFEALGIRTDADTHVIFDNGIIKHCVGCFGCWVKTPGKCVMNDGYSDKVGGYGFLPFRYTLTVYHRICCPVFARLKKQGLQIKTFMCMQL